MNKDQPDDPTWIESAAEVEERGVNSRPKYRLMGLICGVPEKKAKSPRMNIFFKAAAHVASGSPDRRLC